MKNKNKLAFTLIELVIAMTIFFILVTMSYIPYNYYINKAKIRTSIREISQSLYEARNMAIN
jgi:prepilin-type N-terminal cleavage/methylation domain-containing protein